MAPETRAGAINQGTKLRNSCDACAAAKIKCTQEKPSCAYCAKRLKVCVYGASKRVRRTGRAHTRGTRENGSSGTTTCTTATTAATTAATCLPSPMPTAPELSGSCSAVGSVSGTEMAMTPFQSFVPTSPLLGQDWPDFLASLMSPGTTTSSTEPSTSTEWFNLDASFDSFPCLDESTLGFSLSLTGHDQSNTTSRKIPVGPTATKEGTTTSGNNDVLDSLTKSNGGHSMDISPFLTDTQAEARPVSPVSLPGNLSSVRRNSDGRPSIAIPPVAQCHCFTRILRYLARLSLDSSETWATSENGDASTKYPNFEHVYQQIENMSDEMAKVLQCSCSRESDVVILLSLVISKIQAWYVAAVNAVISDEDEFESLDGSDANSAACPPRLVLPSLGTDLDGDESEGEDRRRIFIQHVLSRLTGLQILISRLSQHSANTEAESQSPGHSVVEGKILVMPFSDSLLRALSSDLRDRLCGMSRAIAEKLRVA